MTGNRPGSWPRQVIVPVFVAVAQALVILGPAMGRGVVITHDMPWSPRPLWTPFVLGLDTPAPRAVPSDAAMVLLGKVLGPSMAQHLVLLSLLVGLALGVVALVSEMAPHVGVVGRCVAGVVAVWNPFVSERLAVGQWVVVLGLAVLPWGLRACLRVLRGKPASYAVCVAIAVAAIGGVNSMLLVSGSMLVLLGLGMAVKPSARIARGIGWALLVSAGGASAWALPALTAADGAGIIGGIDEFAPAADSPMGVVGSLLGGGGFWNAATHPEPRQHILIAACSALLMVVGVVTTVLAVPGRRAAMTGLVVVFAAVLALSVVGAARPVWTEVVNAVPGGGALRDSQKLIAVWVVLGAAGFGIFADRVASRLSSAWRGPVAALLIALPMLLSPQLVWGIGGRLEAVTVPSDIEAGLSRLEQAPPGDVGLLPWSQYRRYEWNEDRVSLTLAPRVIDRVVLFDDSLPLRSGVVPGENLRAAAVSERIAGGASAEAALLDAGVRYVAAELGTGQDVDTTFLRAQGHVVVDEPHLLVVDLGRGSETAEASGAVRAGWAVTIITLIGVLCACAVRGVRSKLPVGLIRSRP
ncbi:hypothetical protein N802_17175 [Knoellia sinensis KCTC 19936]|uniref:Uncharacterized protein n=1 Tax=Knoellia sinensis KCTC 19936 TaxID=1385520 RepID=A0A0A0J5R1_9MICO|nr:hypothetical protein [Knoellia sinensis]KGN32690.1 hypothetical protein N802_17175 [Knoellia sinensis KCTC 19936]